MAVGKVFEIVFLRVPAVIRSVTEHDFDVLAPIDLRVKNSRFNNPPLEETLSERRLSIGNAFFFYSRDCSKARRPFSLVS